jgi:TRAP-type C4-dicarboxylate transport system permease large subunit
LRRRARGRIVWSGLVETGVATSTIMLLVVGAGLFSLALATTQLPQRFAEWAAGLPFPTGVMLVLLLVPFLVLGMFIDGYSMILLTMPVLLPTLQRLGIDPVLFGILVTKTTEIGAISPPVGLNVFVVKNAVPGLDIRQAFAGVMPFIGIELLLLAVLIAFPSLTLGLAPG